MSNILITEDNVLACPNCTSAYYGLHQFSADVFFRAEDAKNIKGLHINHLNEVSESQVHNPSSRRSGLTIRFWCEQCDVLSSLNIYQHKGCTYIEFHAGADKPEDFEHHY